MSKPGWSEATTEIREEANLVRVELKTERPFGTYHAAAVLRQSLDVEVTVVAATGTLGVLDCHATASNPLSLLELRDRIAARLAEGS